MIEQPKSGPARRSKPRRPEADGDFERALEQLVLEVESAPAPAGHSFIRFALGIDPLTEVDLYAARAFLQVVPHPVLWIDHDHLVRWRNRAAEAAYPKGAGPCHSLFHDYDEPCDVYGEPCPKKASEATSAVLCVPHVHRFGRATCFYEVLAIPVEGGSLLEIHIPVEELFAVDGLTGTYTRAYFEQAARRELAVLARMEASYCLVMVDVDRFKRFNDEHGHLAGDRILAEVGRAIREHVRSTDLVGRWGGEEFAILLPGENTRGGYLHTARVQDAVRAIQVWEADSWLQLTASFGLYSSHHDYDLGRAVRAADNALYRAKRAGRDRVEIA